MMTSDIGDISVSHFGIDKKILGDKLNKKRPSKGISMAQLMFFLDDQSASETLITLKPPAPHTFPSSPQPLWLASCGEVRK